MSHTNYDYAMPTPRPYTQLRPPVTKNQPNASSSRATTPYRRSPISTPGISDATSDTLYTEDRPNSVVQCDEQSLLRVLGLSAQDVEDGDVTAWESPSFTAWLTQQRAEDARTKYRTTSSYAPANNTALNPRADEFVPMAARLQGPAPGHNGAAPEVGAAVLLMHHPWMSKFRSGSVTLDPNVRMQYAREVVRAGNWDAQVLQDLVGKFTERVMESSGENLNVVAAFAKTINSAFVDSHQMVCARGFREQMMRCLWVEIDAFWNPANPSSFLRSIPTTDKPILSPALSLPSFVGELYCNHLVHGAFVHQCLNLLVNDMYVIEQLRAARVLLSRLDYHLFDENPQAMDGVIATINKHATRIVPGQSALGEAFDVRTVQVQVEDINIFASRWSAPGPSARRLLTKEAFSDTGLTPRQSTFGRPTPPPRTGPTPSIVYATNRKGTPVRR